jgi:hypothetical protein
VESVPEMMVRVSMAPVMVSEAPMMRRSVRVPPVSLMTVSPMTVTAVSVSPMPAAVAAAPLGEARRSREKRQCDNNRGRSQQI